MVGPGDEIDRRRRQGLVAQPIGDLQALASVLDRGGPIIENVLEPPKPIEHLGQTTFVVQRFCQGMRLFQVPAISFEILPGYPNGSKLKSRVNLPLLHLWRHGESLRYGKSLLEVCRGFCVCIKTCSLISG